MQHANFGPVLHTSVLKVPVAWPNHSNVITSFAWAPPIHIFRISHSVDVGISTVLDIAVLKLVVGSEQCSDAFIGQHHSRSDWEGQPTFVS